MRPLVAIGVGCRKGASADAVVRLVQQALRQVSADAVPRLFTVLDKQNETGLHEAAARLRLEITYLSRQALQNEAPRIRTASPVARARFGIPSVAEAAALAGGGPDVVLIVPRLAECGVTCAVAMCPGQSA
jgi:cobalt-precorrin 5A hydrolase